MNKMSVFLFLVIMTSINSPIQSQTLIGSIEKTEKVHKHVHKLSGTISKAKSLEMVVFGYNEANQKFQRYMALYQLTDFDGTESYIHLQDETAEGIRQQQDALHAQYGM